MPVVLAFVWSATLGERVLQGDVSLQFSLSLLSSKGVGKGITKYSTHTHTPRVFSVLLLANPVTRCGFPAVYY